MRSILGFACAVAMGCLSCGAQTNCGPAIPLKFAVEPLHLRTVAPEEINAIKPSTPADPNLSLSKADASFQIPFSGGDFESRVIRPGEFYLRQAAPASENSIVRFVDGVFRPEVIHLDKVQITCPFWTALKRKNPLCLLSGLGALADSPGGGIAFRVLELSW